MVISCIVQPSVFSQVGNRIIFHLLTVSITQMFQQASQYHYPLFHVQKYWKKSTTNQTF